MTNETLTRSDADHRIRRTATVAAWLGALVAAGSLIMAVVSLWLAADLIPVGTVIVDNGALAIGALLFAICRMFEYGCILQRQDDELL